MKRKQKVFRCSTDTDITLKTLSEALKVSENEVVIKAINALYVAEHNSEILEIFRRLRNSKIKEEKEND